MKINGASKDSPKLHVGEREVVMHRSTNYFVNVLVFSHRQFIAMHNFLTYPFINTEKDKREKYFPKSNYN